MKKILACVACAAALGAAPLAPAAVLTFNNPGIVEVDNTTNIATYTEAGLNIAGDAATFLPLDNIGAGGSGGLYVEPNSTLRLFSETGSFDLLSATFGAFDAGVTGLLNISAGSMSQVIQLGALTSFSFFGFTNLQQVTLTSNIAFILDDLTIDLAGAAVPEPASLGLAGLALAGLMAVRRRRQAAL